MSRLSIASETGLPLISWQPAGYLIYSRHSPEQRAGFDTVLRLAEAPRGVAGRNRDHTFIRKVPGWEPDTPLDQGLAVTRKRIKEQYHNRKQGRRVVE